MNKLFAKVLGFAFASMMVACGGEMAAENGAPEGSEETSDALRTQLSCSSLGSPDATVRGGFDYLFAPNQGTNWVDLVANSTDGRVRVSASFHNDPYNFVCNSGTLQTSGYSRSCSRGSGIMSTHDNSSTTVSGAAVWSSVYLYGDYVYAPTIAFWSGSDWIYVYGMGCFWNGMVGQGSDGRTYTIGLSTENQPW